MKIFVVLLSCLFIAVSGGDVNPVSSSPNNTTQAPTTKIPEPSTTTATTTTTTIKTTSTEPPTTKPTTTTSTTAPTSSEAPTTIAPEPTPVPEPKPNTYVVNGSDNHLIIAKMAMQIDLTYQTADNKSHSVGINIPNDNSTSSSAEMFTADEETMKISWKSAAKKSNSVMFNFKCDNLTYILESVEVSIDPADLPGINMSTPVILKRNGNYFNTSLGNSYRCARLQTFNLTKENDTTVNGHLKMYDLQLQAFKTDNKITFGYANDCELDTPDIVPIAVGCILAGLVVIVLAGYLINRRHSQARGYLSM